MPTNDFLSPYGAPKYESGSAKAASVATLTALKALSNPEAMVHGNEVLVDADGSRWSFHATSTLTGNDILVATPSSSAYASAGRWLRCCGAVDLKLAIGYGTADAAVLLTMPTGARMIVRRCYWEVTTDFTGGSSSAIGLSGPSPHNTKGDLLGGSGGDVAATLVAGVALGTIGADTAAGVLLKAADTVKFDRVTSAFTAGAGYAHVVGDLVLNPGA
jgi:hypothetical protein